MTKTFINLLIKYTTIDEDFINIFFKKFKIGDDLEFHLYDKDVSKYLNITLDNLRRRLQNKYSLNKNNYIEKVDFIKKKSNTSNAGIIYMLNYQCFEKLAMSGDSKKSEMVRNYFIKLRQFILENQLLINQSMEKMDELKKYSKFESIYFFAVDERKNNLFKIGRTIDIVNRIRNYNVGRIKEIDLKYFAIVKNSILIEKCMKNNLKEKQIDNKEIYKITHEKIKKIIDDCYCKYVSKKENEELYKELSDLLGLYAYTKNKVNIKPYIIIYDNK